MRKHRDWRKSADYRDLIKFMPDRWAWEFLRRNPEYIQEWEKELPLELERIKEMLSDPENKDKPELEGYRKNTPESTHFSIGEMLSGKVYKKWGIHKLVNPEQDCPFPNPFNQRRSFALGNIKGGDIGYGKYIEDNLLKPYVPIVYNIMRPLKPQFVNAQKTLLEMQRERVQKGRIVIRNAKKHEGHWVDYLRILDAKAENVSNNEIADTLFPDIPNEYPDYQRNDKMRKSLKRAEYLMKKGYREIAMMR